MDALVAGHTVSGTNYSRKWKWAASCKTRYRQQQAKLRKRVDPLSLCRIATAHWHWTWSILQPQWLVCLRLDVTMQTCYDVLGWNSIPACTWLTKMEICSYVTMRWYRSVSRWSRLCGDPSTVIVNGIYFWRGRTAKGKIKQIVVVSVQGSCSPCIGTLSA